MKRLRENDAAKRASPLLVYIVPGGGDIEGVDIVPRQIVHNGMVVVDYRFYNSNLLPLDGGTEPGVGEHGPWLSP